MTEARARTITKNPEKFPPQLRGLAKAFLKKLDASNMAKKNRNKHKRR
jgi:hypothetical protein